MGATHVPSRVEPRLTVAIVGLGSIGGIAAACLAAAGQYRVIGCTRRALEHLALEQAGGTIDVPLTTFTDPAMVEQPADWVLLATKTHQTETVTPWLARLCAPGTRVAVLQNGIGHIERVAPLANGATVLPVIVYYNGERLAPDRVRLRQGANSDFVVANDDAGRAFAQLFANTPLRVELGDDFVTVAWRKLLINAIASPITALTLQRQAVLRRADVQKLSLALLDEAIAVGRAEGARLADDEAARTLATLFTFAGELGTSMYFDRLAGRPLEVEALTGAIVAAGERRGIATPLNRALLTLLRAINDAVLSSKK
jgi:2-dehydropantoate 2-reductase